MTELVNQPNGRISRKVKAGAIIYLLGTIAVSVTNQLFPGIIGPEASVALSGAVATLFSYRASEYA